MTEQRDLAETIRAKILSEPDVILGDADLMQALISATEAQRGGNVVDLRGVAMDRLEARLTRLEDTHQSVIAAAYDNLAGTNQIHRAVLSLLEPVDFEAFLKRLSGDVADILRVGRIRLVLESHDDADDPALASVADVLSVAEPGFVDEYITLGRDMSPRQVTLRGISIRDGGIYGADWVRSEALIRLNFGKGRLPGLLAFASDDPDQFQSTQGTELLVFLGGVFERAMRRWLG